MRLMGPRGPGPLLAAAILLTVAARPAVAGQSSAVPTGAIRSDAAAQYDADTILRSPMLGSPATNASGSSSSTVTCGTITVSGSILPLGYAIQWRSSWTWKRFCLEGGHPGIRVSPPLADSGGSSGRNSCHLKDGVWQCTATDSTSAAYQYWDI